MRKEVAGLKDKIRSFNVRNVNRKKNKEKKSLLKK